MVICLMDILRALAPVLGLLWANNAIQKTHQFHERNIFGPTGQNKLSTLQKRA